MPGTNGEFDTPIDPRFPAFVATNLSEALPGPFSPSSASVTIAAPGLGHGHRRTARRARWCGARWRPAPRGVRAPAVCGHHVCAFHGGDGAAHQPETIVEGFFGSTAKDLPTLDPAATASRQASVRSAHAASSASTWWEFGRCPSRHRDFAGDVDRLESLTSEPNRLDDDQCAMTVLARDHVVHGWVLSSASILICTAYSVILRALCGHDLNPAPGPEVASAQSLGAVQRLAAAARSTRTLPRRSRATVDCWTCWPKNAEISAALMRDLTTIGHRGPAEVEMRSRVFADDPELLVRIVANAVEYPDRPAARRPDFPLHAKPVARIAAGQLRDREIRRDRMVRAIWILRNLLREYGSRLRNTGRIDTVDDVFYLLVTN